MTRSVRRRWWLLAIAAFLVAVIGAEWLGPRIVAAAYREESFGWMNRLIGGRDRHDLAFYLSAWTVWSRRGLVALAVAGLGLAGVIRSRAIWLSGIRRALDSGPQLTPSACMGIAAWFGAIGGTAEVVHIGIRQMVERLPTSDFTLNLLWLGPLAASAGFLILSGALVLLMRLVSAGRPHTVPLRLAVFVFAFLALYGLLESPEFRIAGYAVLLLSAGLAVTAARLAAGREAGLRRLVRVTAPIIATAVLGVLAMRVVTQSAALERRTLAQLPAPAQGLPNVLLIILDTVRAADLGLYGYERATTPNLTRLADSALVFDRAIATAPWTLTSHVSMFTGRLPHETSAGFRTRFDDVHPTLAEVLRDNGYATAGFVANFNYTTKASGLERGFTRYEDYPVNLGQLLMSAWLTRSVSAELPVSLRYRLHVVKKKPAPMVTGQFVDWLRDRGDRPFFAFLNYMDAHAPYLPPEPYRSLFFEQGMNPERRKHRGNTKRGLRGARALYDGAIAQLDGEIARIGEALRALGLAENTLVIISSDHGELFGEHGLMDHANAMYDPLLHVPLVMRFPGTVPAGVRVGESVSLVDLPATVLDLVGLGGPAALPGQSLRRFWQDSSITAGEPAYSELDMLPDADDWEPIARGPMSSLVLDELHLIENGDGVVELYDLARDPDEAVDLSGTPAMAPCAAALKAMLDSTMAKGPSAGAPRLAGPPSNSGHPGPEPAACRRSPGT